MSYFEDRLGALGAGAGAFVALVALATLAGQPWVYNGGGAAVQVVGCLLALAAGVGIALLTNEARWRQYREGR
jgi:hypothetical protein